MRRTTDSMTHERGELAAGQHEVAHRELVVDDQVEDALVEALVAAAQQREAPRARELAAPRPG